MSEFAEAKEGNVPQSMEATWESEVFSFKDLALLRKCIQCGTCSGSCGVAPYADYSPRMVVNMVGRGDVKSALGSRMIFLCTSCLACSTRCPRGIPVADLMVKLRNMSISSRLAGADDGMSSVEFVRNVLKRGRVYEPELIIRLAMRTSPVSLLSMRDVVLTLLRKGKFWLPSKSHTNLGDLRRRFEEVERVG